MPIHEYRFYAKCNKIHLNTPAVHCGTYLCNNYTGIHSEACICRACLNGSLHRARELKSSINSKTKLVVSCECAAGPSHHNKMLIKPIWSGSDSSGCLLSVVPNFSFVGSIV